MLQLSPAVPSPRRRAWAGIAGATESMCQLSEREAELEVELRFQHVPSIIETGQESEIRRAWQRKKACIYLLI